MLQSGPWRAGRRSKAPAVKKRQCRCWPSPMRMSGRGQITTRPRTLYPPNVARSGRRIGEFDVCHTFCRETPPIRACAKSLPRRRRTCRLCSIESAACCSHRRPCLSIGAISDRTDWSTETWTRSHFTQVNTLILRKTAEVFRHRAEGFLKQLELIVNSTYLDGGVRYEVYRISNDTCRLVMRGRRGRPAGRMRRVDVGSRRRGQLNFRRWLNLRNRLRRELESTTRHWYRHAQERVGRDR